MSRRYISVECLPPRLPLFHGIVLWLLLDRLDAHGIVWGAVGMLWGLWFIAAFIEIIRSDEGGLPGFGRRK